MASLLKVWVVRHLDDQGRQVPKSTPGARKVKERSAKWYGQYKDLEGRRRRVPLCTDKAAARQMLAAIEREVQLGRAGVIDPYASHRKSPIAAHVADYEVHVRNRGITPRYLADLTRELKAVIDHSGARSLAELTPESVERFLGVLEGRGSGPATRNKYLKTAKSFTKWCLLTRRTGEDPLACLSAASRAIRRKRRALTPDELARLLKAARERPLHEALEIRIGPRKGSLEAKIHPDYRAEMERVGRERSLIYKTLVYTGLRRGELEALEVRHLTLTGDRPCLALPGKDTKNGEIATIPLRADLVSDLAEWIGANKKSGTDRVFKVGEDLVRLLKRDLAKAGIPYRDAQGRTVDVHALRHTTATYLARAKVSPRVAQRFMRHSDIRLTMQTYIDADLLDENEALEAMPDLPITGEAGSGDRGRPGGHAK